MKTYNDKLLSHTIKEKEEKYIHLFLPRAQGVIIDNSKGKVMLKL